MGLFFTNNDIAECALCGSTASLTGEHKLKASLLKMEFGDRPAYFHSEQYFGRPKLVQSPKSKLLHFNSKICARCNSSATQPADAAFNNLHQSMKERYNEGLQLTDDNYHPIYVDTDDAKSNVFRYFAKLLCCYMAETGGPRPKLVAHFAIGRSHRNPIFLKITRDEEYQQKLIEYNSEGFAQHGGLWLGFDASKKSVRSANSALSIGGVTYEFRVELNWLAVAELRWFYPDFFQKALAGIIND